MTTDKTKSPSVSRQRSDRMAIMSTKGYVKTATETLFKSAKTRASIAVRSARSWFTHSTETFTQLESLSTVMFSPLAAHPVYRSETMVKAIQLMKQQQQQQQTSSNDTLFTPIRDLVSQGKVYSWPSSTVLLQVDIPEISNPITLFQGFASTYPSFATLSPKQPRQRKKKQINNDKFMRSPKGLSKSLTQFISEREKRTRDCDKISMQKMSASNEIDQINLQINELSTQRNVLKQKWQALDEKDLQLQLSIDDLNELILDIEEGTQNSNDSDSDNEEEYHDAVCFKTVEGHTNDILCLEFNHPKGILVSSSLDGSVRIWDLDRHQHLGNIEGHTEPVRCMQLDKARLLTGSNDGTIKHWNLSLISSEPSGDSLVRETFTLKGHQAAITALDASRHTTVSGSNDRTIRQWDLETQECVLSLDVSWELTQNNQVNYLHDFIGALQVWDFAMATGTLDGKIRMWDMRTGQAHRRLHGHSAPITCLQFDQVHLVSGSLDGTIKIWDLRTGSVFDTLTFNSPVSSLRFDSRKIISSNGTNKIDVYERTSFQHTELYGHKNRVNAITFNHGVLASGGSDSVVNLWSI